MRGSRYFATRLVFVLILAGVLGSCGVIRRRLLGGETPTPPSTPQAGQPAEEMTLITAAGARGAVCNDGTPAKYYLRRGTGAGSRLWHIHLQGGGFCYSNATCDERQRGGMDNFMTSDGLPPTMAGNGAMSTGPQNIPQFANANDVFIHYCSSDLWSGDREASADTGDRHFRGLRIVDAVIEDLMDPAITPAPNLADAKQVLLSGSSAGGMGVLVHLDRLAERLSWASVRGFDDAGWIMDVASYDPTIDAAGPTSTIAYQYWNGTVDASCAAASPGAEGHCYLGQYAYSYIAAPLFVQIAQQDKVQLGGLGVTQPLDAGERAYVNDFGEAVRVSLEPVSAVFSPAGVNHGLLLREEFWRLRIEGKSLGDVLEAWFFGKPGMLKLIEK